MIGQLFNEEVREHKLHKIILFLWKRFSVCSIFNRKHQFLISFQENRECRM